ncbi:MAG: LemA family protein [Candidatus Omnitrophota bacterium]
MNRKLIILAVFLLFIIIGFGGIYNGIISKNENVKTKWAQVESQLRRRGDLIGNLVNSVRGYATHENTLLEDITKARSQWQDAGSIEDKIKGSAQVDTMLSRLMVVVENYPNLKANEPFLKLMDELAGTENRIAVERMRYNEAVRDYNIIVRRFPSNLIARMFGYEEAAAYIEAGRVERAAPVVKF